MPGNPTPIYSRVGAYGQTRLNAALTASNGVGTVGTDIFLAFTADATNGSFVQRVRWSATANVAPTATTATVGRIYISSSNTVANTATCSLFQEVALPSVYAANATVASYPIDVPMNIALPPGHAILVSTHGPVVPNTAWVASVFAGNY
jgi:hypothetical protein